MDGLTPEQEDMVAQWMNDPGRHTETAEDVKWAELASAVETFIDGANEAIEGIDWLAELGIGGDMNALREALSTALSKFMPVER